VLPTEKLVEIVLATATFCRELPTLLPPFPARRLFPLDASFSLVLEPSESSGAGRDLEGGMANAVFEVSMENS